LPLLPLRVTLGVHSLSNEDGKNEREEPTGMAVLDEVKETGINEMKQESLTGSDEDQVKRRRIYVKMMMV